MRFVTKLSLLLGSCACHNEREEIERVALVNELEQDVKKETKEVKRKSLKAAGLSFLLADSALITSGLLAGQKKLSSAGALGLTAGAVGAIYGNPKAEKQLEQTYKQLGAYLRKQNIEVPKDLTTEALAKEGGVLDYINSFLHNHPAQVMNTLYALIGVQFARQAMEGKTSRFAIPKGQRSLFTSGCFLIAGALGGILIQEKKPNPEHPPQRALAKAWSWIQEKPLRLTGTLFNINQVLFTVNATTDYRKTHDKKVYAFKLLTAAAFTLGNTLLAFSSKSESGGHPMDEKTRNELAETSARVIAAQPKQVQDALVEQISGYLASKPDVGMKAEEISQLLHEKLGGVEAGKPEPEQPTQQWQERIAQQKDAQEKDVAAEPAPAR